MNKKLKYALLIILVIIVLIQFIPLDRSNPPVTSEIQAPPEVMKILKNSCYDCHSNETRWPVYSHIAPVSWLVVSDVHEAREEMNFSEWGQIKPGKQLKHLEEIVEETEEGDMPLPIYLIMHSGARLAADDLATLKTWADEMGALKKNGDSEEEDEEE
ncbi:MAG: heme-binding domain-containing protein [Calditrichia bacterium]